TAAEPPNDRLPPAPSRAGGSGAKGRLDGGPGQARRQAGQRQRDRAGPPRQLIADLAGRAVGGELVEDDLCLGGDDALVGTGTGVRLENGLDRASVPLLGDEPGV